ETRLQSRHPVQPGARGVDAAQQVGLGVAGEVDERAAALGQLAVAGVQPAGCARQRLLRRVAQAGELGVRVPVPAREQLGPAGVGLVAEDAGEVGVREVGVDGQVLAGLQRDADLEDDPRVAAQLVVGHARYYYPTCLWKSSRSWFRSARWPTRCGCGCCR